MIEKNVPKPNTKPYRNFKNGYSKYPFAEMEVGDSVLFPGEGNNGPAYAAARKAGSRNGRKYSGFVQEGGIRIWRDA